MTEMNRADFCQANAETEGKTVWKLENAEWKGRRENFLKNVDSSFEIGLCGHTVTELKFKILLLISDSRDFNTNSVLEVVGCPAFNSTLNFNY